MNGKQIQRKLLAAVILLMTFCTIPIQAEDGLPDKQTLTDAYVYMLGRAIVIRQEHTDLRRKGDRFIFHASMILPLTRVSV